MTESINNEYFQITQNWETWENKSKKLKILFSEPEDKYPEFEEEEEERWNKELL